MQDSNDLLDKIKLNYLDWDQYLNNFCFDIIENAHKNNENIIPVENLADSMLNGIFRYLILNKFSKLEFAEWLKQEYIDPIHMREKQ